MQIPLPLVQDQAQRSPAIGGSVPDVAEDRRGEQLQQLGGGLQSFGLASMEIAGQLRLEQDAASTKKAYTSWAEFVSQRMTGPDGYLHTVGEQAVGDDGARRAQVLSEIEDQRTAIEKTLGSEIARGMFRQAVDQRMLDVKSRIYGHEATQRRVWHIGTTRAMQLQEEREAVDAALWGEVPAVLREAGEEVAREQNVSEGRGTGFDGGAGPMQVGAPGEEPQEPVSRPNWKAHRDTALEQADELSRLLGEPAPARQARLAETRSNIHAQIVEGLLEANRLKEAQSFVGKLGKRDLLPDARSKIDRMLRQASEADRSLSVGIQLFNDLTPEIPEATEWEGFDAEGLARTLRGEGLADVPPEQLRAGAAWRAEVHRSMQPGGTGAGIGPDTDTMLGRAAEELERRFTAGELTARELNMAMSYVRERHSILVGEEVAQARSALEDTEQFFAQNPSVKDVNSPSFPARLRDRLINSGKLADGIRMGATRVTNPTVYRQLLVDSSQGLLDGMSEDQLFVRYYSGLNASDWNEAQSRWAQSNKREDFKPINSLVGLTEDIERIAYEAGILTEITNTGGFIPDGDDESVRFSTFKSSVQQRWNSINAVRAQHNQSPMSTEEMLATASRMAQAKWLGGDEPFAWEPIPRENELDLYRQTRTGATVYLSEIPRFEQQAIRDSYRLQMLPADDRIRIADQLEAINNSADPELIQRRKIEALWNSLGMSGITVDPQFMVDQWELERAAAKQASLNPHGWPTRQSQDRLRQQRREAAREAADAGLYERMGIEGLTPHGAPIPLGYEYVDGMIRPKREPR